ACAPADELFSLEGLDRGRCADGGHAGTLQPRRERIPGRLAEVSRQRAEGRALVGDERHTSVAALAPEATRRRRSRSRMTPAEIWNAPHEPPRMKNCHS